MWRERETFLYISIHITVNNITDEQIFITKTAYCDIM